MNKFKIGNIAFISKITKSAFSFRYNGISLLHSRDNPTTDKNGKFDNNRVAEEIIQYLISRKL